MKFSTWNSVVFALGLCAASAGQAQPQYVGAVATLEVWNSGNVSFTLNTSVGTCNGQFVINRSDPGLKNQFAVLMIAKATGKSVRVYSSACIPAENYGSSYNNVLYIYPQD